MQLNFLIEAWGNFGGYYYYWPPGQTDYHPGMDLLANKILGYGCYCQLRNFERYRNVKEGIDPGNKLLFFENKHKPIT